MNLDCNAPAECKTVRFFKYLSKLAPNSHRTRPMNFLQYTAQPILPYRLERKKGRLVDRFSDELFREKCGKKIDAGSLSLSALLLRRRMTDTLTDKRGRRSV